MKFSNKVVLVTGAGAGIGLATAEDFAAQGALVVVNAKTKASADAAAKGICEKGGCAVAMAGDVSDEGLASALMSQVISKYGKIDILVNNAGIVIGGDAENTTTEEWDLCMSVNVRSVFLLSKLAVKYMKAQQDGGVIVNVSSAAALRGVANRAVYSASKGAIISLTKAMAMDHLRDNIRINCICPGTILTPSFRGRVAQSADPEKAMEMFVKRQPMGRLGLAQEISSSILYLASPDNSFMTGAIVSVDGGMTI